VQLDPAQRQRHAGPLVIPRRAAAAFLMLLVVLSCLTQSWFFLPPLSFFLWKVTYGNV
jgi:hypothetical protein